MLTREAGLIAMADMAHSGELSDDPISEVDSVAASQKDDSGDPDSDPSELLVVSSSSDLGRQLEAFCVESTQPNVDDYFSQEERPARDADSAPSSQHSFSIAEDLEYLLRGGRFKPDKRWHKRICKEDDMPLSERARAPQREVENFLSNKSVPAPSAPSI